MIPNPFEQFASTAAQLITDGWVAMWLTIWSGGLWLLRLTLGWMDAWLTPDLSAGGPGRAIYPVTFWLGGAVLLIMTLIQIGIAAGRRDGRGLARTLIGVGQFAVVWGGWIGYTVAITGAAGGLTRTVMESLMGVTTWRDWQPWKPFDVASVSDAGVATVLGFMGLLMWIGAIGHLLVILTRDAALLIIVATGPIAAAGLANETTRTWFWKAFRWFHAAAFTPLLVVLVTGVGMKMAEGVVTGTGDDIQASVGTAIPAIVLICVAVVSPIALFKLLGFVDPGTASGAAMRAGLAATGGLQGLLRGGATSSSAPSSAAAQADNSGRSAGEASAETAAATRATGAIQAGLGMLGTAGGLLAGGIGMTTRVGAAATAIGSDVANQEGVGNNSYYPDYTDRSRRDASRANREQRAPNSQPDDGAADTPTPPAPPPPASPPVAATGLSAAEGSTAGGAAAAGTGDAAAAAAAI